MIRWLLICFAGMVLFNCSGDSVSGGGGTNVGDEAAIAGTINDNNGPAVGVVVSLLPEDFNPVADNVPDSLNVTTGSDGKYLFKVSGSGVYNVQAWHSNSGTAVLEKGVEKFEKKVTVPNLMLQVPGKVIVHMPDYLDKDSGYVYIPGTTLLSRMESDSIVRILLVPPVENMQLIFSDDQEGTLTTLDEDVDVDAAGRFIISEFNLWTHKTKITINTSAAGITLNKDVMGFPILVRLNTENFSFEQAEEDGSDIRFTKVDGVIPLFYEIERWNSALSVAEVWVRVDTIFADSNSQSILMYTGNSEAKSLSDGNKVFDSTNGFRSVWHLGGNTTSSTVQDAAGNFDGVLKSADAGIYTSSVTSFNVIGNGFEFEDWKEETWIDLGGDKGFVNNESEITMSLWMDLYTDTLFTTSIMSFSINGDLSKEPESRVSLDLFYNKPSMLSRAVDTDTAETRLTITPGVVVGQWFYVTGVINFESGKMSIYINGELLNERDTDHSQNRTDSANSTLGAIGSNDNGTDDYFSGLLDEVRLEVSARPAEWIKLCYENQKMDQMLITVE